MAASELTEAAVGSMLTYDCPRVRRRRRGLIAAVTHTGSYVRVDIKGARTIILAPDAEVRVHP